MHTKKELAQRLLLAGIHPNKKLGQNFLVNPRICSQIIHAVTDFAPRTVIEIGPGLGALTDELLGLPFKTILIEIDSGLFAFWKESYPEVSVFHQDALEFRWEILNEEEPVVVLSNLPYSIAAHYVVMMSSLATQAIKGMVLMFQKEVAQRIQSKVGTKDYGMLSVMAQAHWEIETVIDAGPQDFFPVPNVGSRVLRFTSKQTRHQRDSFLQFVKLSFSHRRKKLFSNLQGAFKRERLEQAFGQLDLSADTRAQELSVQQFLRLFGVLNLLETGKGSQVVV